MPGTFPLFLKYWPVVSFLVHAWLLFDEYIFFSSSPSLLLLLLHTHTYPKYRGTQPGPSIIYKGKVIKQMQSGGGKKSPKAQRVEPTATAGGQVV